MSKKVSDSHLDREKLEIIKWVTTLKDRGVMEMLKMVKEDPKKVNWWHGISGDEKKQLS